MNENKSFSDLLVDGYKKGEFDRKRLAEEELLKSRTYDELLYIAAAMSVYINTAMPILNSNLPLMTQAFLNGIEKAKNDTSQKMPTFTVTATNKQETVINNNNYCLNVP